MKQRIPARAFAFQSTNSTALHDSASRAVMYGSHRSQAITFAHPTEEIIQTGMEKKFGEYTFKVRMPEDGTVLAVIERFRNDRTEIRVSESPDRIVIYESRETRQVDYFTIPSYCSNHQNFGFKYVFTENMNLLRPGAFIPGDTIFADSPNIGPNGEYKTGRIANVVFNTVSSVAEDAIEICDDIVPMFAYTIIEKRVVNFGSSRFPLNLFGSRDRFQAFPNIGDYIREDGLLMTLRQYDDPLAPALMSVDDVREPDHYRDEGVYVRPGKGRVIDIQIVKNNLSTRVLPEGMCGQLENYSTSFRNYHADILEAVRRIKRERKYLMNGDSLSTSPKLHRLIVKAMAIADSNACGLKQPLHLVNRKEPLDEYHATFTIEYTVNPAMGGKLSDKHGG